MLQLNATGKQWGSGVQKPGEFLVTFGFGILIALLVLSGWLMESFKQTPKQRLPEQLAHVEAKEKGLASVRKFFGQGVSAARDFLVNNHPNAAEAYAQDLRKAKAGVAAGIAELRQSGSDPAVLKQFEKDLADYWSVLDHACSFDAKQKSENGYDYLREDIFPARNTAQDSIRELADDAGKERISLLAGYDQSRDSLLTWFYVVLGACVLFTILLAWASLSYRSSLQRESVIKFDEVARARDDLEHLSGKLLKVQEEERRRLSRELHDGIGQTLTALRMEIHQAHLNAGTGTAAAERLLRARMLAEEAVHTVKDISLLLRPPLLDDLGLEPAIAWQTDQFTRRTGIPCRFRAAGLQEMLP
ncbi:MAG: histidine kinase, partial [Bryobacterales bacterium]|nr:histidine kinase [Bryobacterales bacterium]